MEKEKEDFDPTIFLKNLMDKSGMYFTDDNYTTPSTRYEAWLMASCLSNLIIAKTLSRLADEVGKMMNNPDIFQKQSESPIIKDKIEDEKPEKKEVVLRKRRGE